MRRLKAFLLAISLFSIVSVVRALDAPADPAATPEFFETKVRPVLADKCYSCHTSTAMGGLRLDSREAMLKGATRGPAVVPGDPDKSVLITAIRQTDEK